MVIGNRVMEKKGGENQGFWSVFFFGSVARRILVSLAVIEPMLSEVEAWSPNHMKFLNVIFK